MFPFAKKMFPFAKKMFPFAKKMFPFAKKMFPFAKKMFHFAKKMFPFVKIIFPRPQMAQICLQAKNPYYNKIDLLKRNKYLLINIHTYIYICIF